MCPKERCHALEAAFARGAREPARFLAAASGRDGRYVRGAGEAIQRATAASMSSGKSRRAAGRRVSGWRFRSRIRAIAWRTPRPRRIVKRTQRRARLLPAQEPRSQPRHSASRTTAPATRKKATTVAHKSSTKARRAFLIALHLRAQATFFLAFPSKRDILIFDYACEEADLMVEYRLSVDDDELDDLEEGANSTWTTTWATTGWTTKRKN